MGRSRYDDSSLARNSPVLVIDSVATSSWSTRIKGESVPFLNGFGAPVSKAREAEWPLLRDCYRLGMKKQTRA
jgi:hypothetical protein